MLLKGVEKSESFSIFYLPHLSFPLLSHKLSSGPSFLVLKIRFFAAFSEKFCIIFIICIFETGWASLWYYADLTFDLELHCAHDRLLQIIRSFILFLPAFSSCRTRRYYTSCTLFNSSELLWKTFSFASHSTSASLTGSFNKAILRNFCVSHSSTLKWHPSSLSQQLSRKALKV